MPYELFLAQRYLFAHRKRPLARVTTLAAIVGIAFGVAALVVALALSNGFRDEMRDKILRGTAHRMRALPSRLSMKCQARPRCPVCYSARSWRHARACA